MPTTIFLSYARDDDEPFVRRLHEGLKNASGSDGPQFDVWFDRVSMPSRLLTFHQEIRDAINARERLLLVVGPRAISSRYVTQEWQFAYFAANKCVNPIVRLDGRDAHGKPVDGYSLIPEDLKLLHAEDFRDDARFDEHLKNLIRQLSEPLPPVGKLVAVPELPPGYRAQPERLRALRDMLLIDLQKPVVVTGEAARVGLQGMGGIGKSVLANALAHHPEVQRAFQDNIYWIKFGQHPSIEERQRWLALQLGGDGLFNDRHTGKEQLRLLLADRAALLILDDVWERDHADAFNVVGARSRILLTTRDAGLVTALAARENHYRVELPTLAEARAILGGAADVPPDQLPAEAEAIIKECGRLPLALALCGGMVRDHISWSSVLEAFREHDLEFLSSDHPAEEQHQNAWIAMDISLRVLPADEQRRFTELAVFRADTGAPNAAVKTLWQQTAGLSARQTEVLLAKFARRSLVQRPVALDGRVAARIDLHDLLEHFATGMAVKQFGSLRVLHRHLLEAYHKLCPSGWPSGPNDGYFFETLIYHLAAAGDNSGIGQCFRNGFPEAKRKAGYSIYSVGLDCDLAMNFLAHGRDVGNMLAIASAFGVGAERPQLPNYESYFLWSGDCMRAADDSKAINEVIGYVENQPSGQDRLRMAAELLIALNRHPTSQRLFNRFRTELSQVAQVPEESGLDLLAAEALGDLTQAFSLAIELESPGAKRLCRIFKLIRRHPEHHLAPEVFQRLLVRRPRTWDAAWDATVANAGLLSRTPRAARIQQVLISEGYYSGHDPTAEAAQIATYLVDDDRMAVEFVKDSTLGAARPLALQRALLCLAWFAPSLQSTPLVQKLVLMRGNRKCPVSGYSGWRGSILNGHLDQFGFIYSSLRGYKWSPHEAMRIPVFLLWARVLNSTSDLNLRSFGELGLLSPPCTISFTQDDPTIGAWIELGQALCCEGKVSGAQELLKLLSSLPAKPDDRSRISRIGGTLVMSLVLSTFGIVAVILAVALVAALAILLSIVLLFVNLLGLFSQLGLFWSWLRKRRCPSHFTRAMERRSARKQRPPSWLQIGNTWTWQVAAVLLIETGRKDLAELAIRRKDFGNFFRELRPWAFRSPDELVKFIRLFIEVAQESDDANKSDWCCLAEGLTKLSHPDSSRLVLSAGLSLVENGAITLRHLRKLMQRFGTGMGAKLQNPEIERLAACLGRLGDKPDRVASMNDLVSSCREVGKWPLADPYFLAASLLRIGMTRPKETLAEVIYAISRWPVLRSRRLSREARESYATVSQEEIYGPPWIRKAVPFYLYRLIFSLKRILIRSEYSQPFDLVGFAFTAMMRRIVRW